jgi:hypothetical protein
MSTNYEAAHYVRSFPFLIFYYLFFSRPKHSLIGTQFSNTHIKQDITQVNKIMSHKARHNASKQN